MNDTYIGNKYHLGDIVEYKKYFRYPKMIPIGEYSGTILRIDNNRSKVYYEVLRDSSEKHLDYVNESEITELIKSYYNNRKNNKEDEDNYIEIVLNNMEIKKWLMK